MAGYTIVPKPNVSWPIRSLSGAASQCDTFDYKPELIKRHGEKLSQQKSNCSKAIRAWRSWGWRQYGRCGKW